MAAKTPKLEVFQGTNGKWFWSLFSRNGQNIARCSEDGYRTKFEANRAAKAVAKTFAAINN